MIFALRVGEIPLDHGHGTACLACDETGTVEPAFETTEKAAVRRIVARAGKQEVVCEPALEEVAAALGLRVVIPPPWTNHARVELAFAMHLGAGGLDPDARDAIEPAFRAAGAMIASRPWTWLGNSDVLEIVVAIGDRGTRTFEGCAMGSGGQEYGVALYDKPGSMARLEKASRAGRTAEARAIDAYGFTIDEFPEFVVDAAEAAYGAGVAIVPIRLRGGKTRSISLEDLSIMAAAAQAVAGLTPEHPEQAATIQVAGLAVTATATVRGAKKAALISVPASSNAYCQALEIDVPSLAAAQGDERRAAHGAELACQRRVIVHAFPADAPRVLVLVDVAARKLTTLTDVARAGSMLLAYDAIGGVDIRATLRALGIDPGERRLLELGPPQKSTQITQAGKSLALTPALLITGSCGIRRPLGDIEQLRGYLAAGDHSKLHRRLEADAKALFAMHEYGRTHGYLRLRHAGIDEVFSVPWHHDDEPRLYDLIKQAHLLRLAIEAVVGTTPGWDDPWSTAVRLDVYREGPYSLILVDSEGRVVNERDVQLARVQATT